MTPSRPRTDLSDIDDRLRSEAQRALRSMEPGLVDEVVARTRTAPVATIPAGGASAFPIPPAVRWALAACIAIAAVTLFVMWPDASPGVAPGPAAPIARDTGGSLLSRLAPHEVQPLLSLLNDPVKAQFDGLERASVDMARTMIGDLPGKLVQIHSEVEQAAAPPRPQPEQL